MFGGESMSCDKTNCELRGVYVHCLGYPNYPYQNCVFYGRSDEPKEVKMSADLVKKLREDGL